MTLQELQRLINFPRKEVLGTWVRAFEEFNIRNEEKKDMQTDGNYEIVLDWHLAQHVGEGKPLRDKRHFKNN